MNSAHLRAYGGNANGAASDSRLTGRTEQGTAMEWQGPQRDMQNPVIKKLVSSSGKEFNIIVQS